MKLTYVSVPFVLVLLLTLLVACSAPAPTLPSEPGNPTTPGLPTALPAGQWTAFSPGGNTLCADGSPYTYYVRPGTVNKLVVDFQGGGACWNGGTCGSPFTSPSSGGYYTASVSGAPGTGIQPEVGIYDHTNAANPVEDWYHVFVSYCTADIHLGDSMQTYQTPAGEITVHHNGQNNVAAVLSWVENNFKAPESILVTGCSAGAYGAALYTPRLADDYPDADITELGDCGAGVIPESFVTGTDGLKRWNIGAVLPEGVDLTGGVPTTFLADAYVAIGNAYPDVTLAQYNSQYDNVQISFYALQLGLDPEDPMAQQAATLAWVSGLNMSLAKIQTALPESFSSYTSLFDDDGDFQNGTAHCLITRPEFYTVRTSGVSFAAWLDHLLNDPAPPAAVTPPALPTPS